ncbi:hypothetical protein BJ742DRAFT_745719 [Cladochytrium replicatum]|nr:hypothetical protein BJ742DRAFT_745719 [Cladochytrium replicatum]
MESYGPIFHKYLNLYGPLLVDFIRDKKNLELVYNVGAKPLLAVWILLAILPTHWLTKLTVKASLFTNAAIYLLLMVGSFLDPKSKVDPADFMSFDGVIRLYSKVQAPGALLMWHHYLCFDLLAGAIIATDAARSGVPRILTWPILGFTLMFGPVGLLMYFAVRLVLGRGSFLF